MPEDKKIYVAVFKNHPLGPNRYVQAFRGMSNNSWYKSATHQQKKDHFNWALGHKQYNYSTTDMNQADFFHLDQTDLDDRLVLESYAPVDFMEVHLTVSVPK